MANFSPASVGIIGCGVISAAYLKTLPKFNSVNVSACADLDPAAAGLAMVLYGHTHRPAAEERDGVWYVNPGSIGPRRFQQPVSYAFLGEDLGVEFVTV